jgi:hypothetical protein
MSEQLANKTRQLEYSPAGRAASSIHRAAALALLDDSPGEAADCASFVELCSAAELMVVVLNHSDGWQWHSVYCRDDDDWCGDRRE